MVPPPALATEARHSGSITVGNAKNDEETLTAARTSLESITETANGDVNSRGDGLIFRNLRDDVVRVKTFEVSNFEEEVGDIFIVDEFRFQAAGGIFTKH